MLFVDESGQDRRASPYEVLAGVAVEDSRVWSLITALLDAEEHFFGERVSGANEELKARKLLKKKTFRLAEQMPPFSPSERATLAQSCRRNGPGAGRRELTAMGQANVAYVQRVLELCGQHQVRLFASIVDRSAPYPASGFLRKDYAYLFERFYYFLDEQPPFHQGLVVFDELERSRSHILVNQMEKYFKETAKGRLRASRVIPEPLFVHSDLTTMIRVADYIAYIIAWGVRVGPMGRPSRRELASLGQAVCALRHRAVRNHQGSPFVVWSFAVIDDLRPRDEREEDDGAA